MTAAARLITVLAGVACMAFSNVAPAIAQQEFAFHTFAKQFLEESEKSGKTAAEAVAAQIETDLEQRFAKGSSGSGLAAFLQEAAGEEISEKEEIGLFRSVRYNHRFYEKGRLYVFHFSYFYSDKAISGFISAGGSPMIRVIRPTFTIIANLDEGGVADLSAKIGLTGP